MLVINQLAQLHEYAELRRTRRAERKAAKSSRGEDVRRSGFRAARATAPGPVRRHRSGRRPVVAKNLWSVGRRAAGSLKNAAGPQTPRGTGLRRRREIMADRHPSRRLASGSITGPRTRRSATAAPLRLTSGRRTADRPTPAPTSSRATALVEGDGAADAQRRRTSARRKEGTPEPNGEAVGLRRCDPVLPAPPSSAKPVPGGEQGLGVASLNAPPRISRSLMPGVFLGRCSRATFGQAVGAFAVQGRASFAVLLQVLETEHGKGALHVDVGGLAQPAPMADSASAGSKDMLDGWAGAVNRVREARVLTPPRCGTIRGVRPWRISRFAALVGGCRCHWLLDAATRQPDPPAGNTLNKSNARGPRGSRPRASDAQEIG